MRSSENRLLIDYLDQVKKKMPEWLKWKEEQLKKIIGDLEEQVIAEANLLSAGSPPTDKDFLEAIDRMGTPESIVKPYKKRGNPKFFIT
ncbi:MAG: hypothetical protein EU521_01695, partial [Promethearchaeota archaeon]